MKAHVQLAGSVVDLERIESISIDAIASTLARNCRFNGALCDDAPVIWHSVADHCVLVSAILENEGGDASLALAGLLHDAHEALIGDIPTPVKRWFGIGDQEKDLEMRVLASFGLRDLPGEVLRAVKTADVFALRMEVNLLGLRPEIFGFDPDTQREWLPVDRRFCDAHGLLLPTADMPLAQVLKGSRDRFLSAYQRLDGAVNLPALRDIALV